MRTSAVVVCGILGLSALCAPAQAAEGLKKVTFVTGSIPGSSWGPIYVAKQAGLYEKAGLDVEVLPGRTSQDGVNAVAAGNAQVSAVLASNIMLSADKGQLVVPVGNLFGRNVLGALVGADTGISSFKELEGKRVLVPIATVQAVTSALVKKAGGDPSKVEFVLVPQPAAAAQAYIAKQADAFITVIPFGESFIAPQRASKILPFAETGDPEPGYSFIVRPDTLKNDRAMVRAFLQATYQAYKIVRADPTRAIDSAAAVIPNYDKALGAREVASFAHFVCSAADAGKPLGLQAKENWVQAAAVYKSLGLLKPDFDAAALVDNSFFEGADSVASESCAP